MTFKAFITGLAGAELLPAERDFLREAQPCGLILFDRNIRDRQQLRRLIGDYRAAVGSDRQLVLIDQEGGRIQRMKPPHWRRWPAGARYGELYRRNPAEAVEAARLVYRMIADELTDVGINVNCVPLLDVPVAGAHDVIGDRALSYDIEAIISLGRAVAEGNLLGGVLPVIKHLPGHGRAMADSHIRLPVIDTPRAELERTDFVTFRALNDLPLAMTGHLLIPALDKERNASVSATIIGEVIRGFIGFDGLLMSDDLNMEALSGTIGERARDVVAAGCDVALYCKGVFADMQATAANVPDLAGKALARFDAAMAELKPARDFDRAHAEAAVARLMS
jgi:beta-N-acetylhexosaminidase